VKNKLICKLPRKNTPQIKQSTEDTRGDQPSNLIPHDKDHLKTRTNPASNLPITRRTSPEDEDESRKQRDDEHHASNQSTTILDEHKNLLIWARRRR
jgi:hypothetical protein